MLITIHPTGCNEQPGPDYPARRPMQHRIICSRVTHKKWWMDAARRYNSPANEQLRSSTKGFDDKKNFSARQREVSEWTSTNLGQPFLH